MELSGHDIAALEDVAARAVPPAERCLIGGWVARATADFSTRRANSVLARADAAAPGIAQRLAAVERFYAARGRPSRFQLSPASRPGELRATLLARGYVPEAETAVQVGALDGDENVADDRCALASRPTAQWWSTWRAALDLDRSAAAGPAALFARLTVPAAFAVVALDGAACGVGMAVLDPPWLGLFNLATTPDARGRGVGATVLHALSAWGRRRGARRGYLQVELGNRPAQALYARAGFAEAYRYVYLTGPGGG